MSMTPFEVEAAGVIVAHAVTGPVLVLCGACLVAGWCFAWCHFRGRA